MSHRTPTTTRRIAATAIVGALIGVAAGTAAAGGTTEPSEPAPSSTSGPLSTPDAGFGSPEDAAAAYLAAMAAGDLDAAVGAFAVDQLAANFDLEASLEWIGAYSVASGAPVLPASNELNIAFNREVVRGSVVSQMQLQYAALTMPEFDPLMMTRVEDAAAFAAELEAALDPAVFAGAVAAETIELADIDAEAAATYDSERAGELRERFVAIIGADEMAGVAMRFDAIIAGEPIEVIVTFDAVRYGDGWWLYRTGGDFARFLDLANSTGGILLR